MAAQDVFGIVGTTQAGNFHVERVVAEGGFGVVYRAQHGGFRAPVALKCLKIPEEMSDLQRDAFLEKFREEAELLFRLSAAMPEVVRPLHVDVLHLKDGRFVPFLAMEWLEGESLDGIITKRREASQAPLGLHKVLKMFRPIAQTLAKAHHFPGPNGAVSIIHRDLKPENIFVKNVGGVETMKILDFGIAKAKRAASAAAGRITGRIVPEDDLASFTPAYGAPEQWSPKAYGETGPWTDVWGLGLCMCEAIVGSPPIDGDTWVMRRVTLDPKRRPTPRTLGAQVSKEVEEVFEAALAVDPKKRTKEIETFWSDLERAMGLKPSMGRHDSRAEPEHVEPPPGPKRIPSRTDLPRIGGSIIDEASPVPLPVKEVVRDKEAPAAGRNKRPAGPLDDDDMALLGAAIVGGAPRPLDRRAEPISQRGEPSHDLEFDLEAAPAAPPASPRSPGRGPARDREEERRPQVPMNAAPAVAQSPPARRRSPTRARPSTGTMEAIRTGGDLELDLPLGLSEGAGDEEDLVTAPSEPPPPPAPAPVSEHPPSPRAAARRESMASSPRDSVADLGRASLPGEAALDTREPKEAREAKPDEDPLLELALPTRDGPPPPSGRPPSPSQLALRNFDVETGSSSSVRAPSSTMAPREGTMAPRDKADRHEGHELRDRLKAPVGLLLTALIVALSDVIHNRVTGEHLMLGPVKPFWVAAPLALAGVAFTLWRLMGERDE